MEYYDRLMDVRRKGDWENWIKFFLRGVSAVSDEATDSAKNIIGLQSKYATMLMEKDKGSGKHSALLNILFENPIITKKDVSELLEVSLPTAGTLIDGFCELGILQDASPEKKRYKTYTFGEYLEILQKGTELKRI